MPIVIEMYFVVLLRQRQAVGATQTLDVQMPLKQMSELRHGPPIRTWFMHRGGVLPTSHTSPPAHRNVGHGSPRSGSGVQRPACAETRLQLAPTAQSKSVTQVPSVRGPMHTSPPLPFVGGSQSRPSAQVAAPPHRAPAGAGGGGATQTDPSQIEGGAHPSDERAHDSPSVGAGAHTPLVHSRSIPHGATPGIPHDSPACPMRAQTPQPELLDGKHALVGPHSCWRPHAAPSRTKPSNTWLQLPVELTLPSSAVHDCSAIARTHSSARSA
jgi:hypothetical protein